MKRLLMCSLLGLLIAGCDDSHSVSEESSDLAIQVFQKRMDAENKLAPFSYSNMVFRPDKDNSGEVTSGWVCGDAEMTHSGGTFKMKVRGHVIKSQTVNHVGDLAALPVKTGLADSNAIYKQYCK